MRIQVEGNIIGSRSGGRYANCCVCLGVGFSDYEETGSADVDFVVKNFASTYGILLVVPKNKQTRKKKKKSELTKQVLFNCCSMFNQI